MSWKLKDSYLLLSNQQRLMLWLAGALVLQSIAMLTGYMIEVRHGARFGGDFMVFWQAAQKVAQHNINELYDPHTLTVVLFGAQTPQNLAVPFVYPPPMALLLWPLGYLDYNTAAALWTILPILLFYWLLWQILAYSEKDAKKLYPLAAAYTLPFVTVNLMSGQTGMLVAVLFLAGLRGWQLKRWWAGVAFGAIVIKPQLGILLPVLLLATRQWRMMGAAIATVLVLFGVSTLCFGIQIWPQYTNMLGLFGRFTQNHFAPFASLVTGPYISLHTAGMAAEFAVWVQVVISLFVITVIMQIFRQELRGSPCLPFGLIGCGALLATPHSMAYDTPLLAICTVTIALGAWRKGWENSFELVAFIAIMLMPYLQPATMQYGVPVGWFILLVFFAAALQRYRIEYQNVK